MRIVKYTSRELIKIKEMMSGVMSFASYGLLQKEGEVIGSEIVDSLEKGQGYFEEVSRRIVDRGWAESAEFYADRVVFRKTIESEGVEGAEEPVCIILRGIVRKIYERYYGGLVVVNEVECRGVSGGEVCIFEVRYL